MEDQVSFVHESSEGLLSQPMRFKEGMQVINNFGYKLFSRWKF